MRKLATIRKIDTVSSIEGADAIDVATIGGWKVVVKKGEFKTGDLAVYFEIDSWIPTELAPFLSKGTKPREYNEVKGERLKTVRLRGQTSQGLLLPLGVVHDAMRKICGNPLGGFITEGEDVSEILGIQKWEAPISAQLSGIVKGSFPSIVPKTDQERIQNLNKELEDYKNKGLSFEVTEKLDGSSCTFYLPVEGDFEVCSRNLSLKRDDNNSFWKTAIEKHIADRMQQYELSGYAIQGELVGEGIQGNKYEIKGQEFYVFDIYDTKTGTYLEYKYRISVAWFLGLKHCPIIYPSSRVFGGNTVEDILKFAEGKSILNPKAEREGIVYKCIENPSISFKAISNKFLLKEK